MRATGWAGRAVVWAAAAGGALSIAAIPGDLDGGRFCGRWGCIPPAQTLVAMHLFWLVLLAPGVVLVGRRWPTARKPVGSALILAAVLGLGLLVGRDLTTWLTDVPADYQRFWRQRAAYAVATATDLPLVQLLLAGFGLRAADIGLVRPRAAR